MSMKSRMMIPPRLRRPELARDHLRSFQVGLEYGVVEGAATDETAGIDRRW